MSEVLARGAHSLASGGYVQIREADRGQPPAERSPISLWNVETGSLIRRIDGNPYYVLDVAFLPDGQRLASCGYKNAIRLWNIADGAELLPERDTMLPDPGDGDFTGWEDSGDWRLSCRHPGSGIPRRSARAS